MSDCGCRTGHQPPVWAGRGQVLITKHERRCKFVIASTHIGEQERYRFSLRKSSTQGDIIALGKAHARSTLSVRSPRKGCSRNSAYASHVECRFFLFLPGVEHQLLPLSAPLSIRRSAMSSLLSSKAHLCRVMRGVLGGSVWKVW